MDTQAKRDAWLQAVKDSPACAALVAFIRDEYKPGTFSTSWTSYAIEPEREEELINAAFHDLRDHYGDDGNHPDWFREVPNLCVALITQFGENDGLRNAIARFAGDYMCDAVHCFAREE